MLKQILLTAALLVSTIGSAHADSNWLSQKVSKGLLTLANKGQKEAFAALIAQNIGDREDAGISPDGCETVDCVQKPGVVIVDVVIVTFPNPAQVTLAYEILRQSKSLKALAKRGPLTMPLRRAKLERLVVYLGYSNSHGNPAEWNDTQVEVYISDSTDWKAAKQQIETAIKDLETLPGH